MRSVIKHICTIALTLVCAVFLLTSPCEAGEYDKKLSESQKASLCQQLRSQQLKTTQGNQSLGGGIIPDSVFTKIYGTTKNINDKVAILLTLGHSLTCHAVHAGKNEVTLIGIKLFDYPDFSVWFCGAIIYMVGFMMTISISFYVADIAFKLGFAIIMLPIGIALWPFPLTKDRLFQIISIILKNSAIFVFLAITVSYALNLVDAALNTNLADETPQGSSLFSHLKAVMAAAQSGLDWDKANGMQKLFFAINNNMTDIISENFVLFSSYFLVMLCALVYGFKLVGSTIPDYVDKFFPDKAFGGGMAASPMHSMMTQGMDFVKKNTIDKAASWAGDVVKTQTGRAMAGVGNLVSGKYNGQIKNYWNNPGNITKDMANAVHNTGATVAKGVSSVVMGTAGRIVLGQQASQDLHNKLSKKIDKGADFLDKKAESVANAINTGAHARQEQRQQKREALKEQFNASGLGQKINQAKEFHNKAQDTFNSKINSLREKRANIDAETSHSNIKITEARTRALDAIENWENRVIQRRNSIREKLNNWDKAYTAIDDFIPKKETDNKLVAGLKSITRGIMKAPIGIVDGAHRVTNGAVTLALNASTVAVGGIAKSTVKIGTGLAEAPMKIAGAVKKAPSAIAEGTLKAINITEHLKGAKNAVKSGINLTGEVLARTGEKMQQNYKSPEELAQEEAEKLADWEHEQDERRKRGEEY